MGSVLGGGGGGGGSSQSGYSALPKALKDAFNPLGIAVGQYTNPANAGVKEMFTPLAQTADETAAMQRIRQGFTPTAESLKSDISMLMNPFDQSVIDVINREGQGQYSALKQAMTQAGQLGSNRSMLGANDIDLSRMQQIGTFKQNQYNQALNQIFDKLVPQRAADAQGMLGIGSFERGLDTATKQAPISALQSGTSMIAPFVSGGTSTSTGANNTLSNIGNLASGLGTAWKAFGLSDSRLKHNIVPLGKENGHNIYEFSYIGDDKRYIGVIAQEVPEAAFMTPSGYLAVDYSRIAVS